MVGEGALGRALEGAVYWRVELTERWVAVAAVSVVLLTGDGLE